MVLGVPGGFFFISICVKILVNIVLGMGKVILLNIKKVSEKFFVWPKQVLGFY